LSAADLARAMGTTPQGANVLVTGMTQRGLVERTPHPTHGRILETYPTDEGMRRFKAALPFIRRPEATMSKSLDKTELIIVKRWLVESARALTSDRKNRRARFDGGKRRPETPQSTTRSRRSLPT
jgi:DNA-binding MarR family transcriptional regulator